MAGFEALMYQGALTAVGDPVFIGFLVFGFFFGFVVMQGQNLPGKTLVLVPAAILALAFLPSWVYIIFGVFLGFILSLALGKLIAR
jgi:hypothetical protein